MAGKIPAGTIATNIDLNGAQAVRSLKELRDAVKSSTSAWRAQQAELKSAGQTVEAAKAKYNGLTETVDKQKKVVESLKSEQNRLKTAQASVDTSTQKGKQTFQNYNEQIQKNSTQLNNATRRLATLTGQQEKARKSMTYQTSGLAKLQSEYRETNSVSRSYIERLESEGNKYRANQARISGYRGSIDNLTKQYKIQSQELDRIASETGKTSSAYRQQQIRVNETATSINKAKTAITGLENENRRINPSIWDKLRSHISSTAKEADHAHRTFKEVFMGSALGNALSNAFSNVGSAIGNAYHQGMDLNLAIGKINSRFANMGMNTRQVKALDNQMGQLKAQTTMTGQNVANLQSHMLSWSTIGTRGAMRMAKTVAGIGDASHLTGDQIEKLGASLGRVGSSGKVTASTLTRITKQAPSFMSALAKGAGMSESKMKSLLATGKVTQKQFQTWMANASKYADNSFKQFGQSQAGAEKAMSSAWDKIKQRMTAPIFNAKTSGLQALKNILTSDELKNAATSLGNVIAKVIEFLDKHKKDLTDITKDVVHLAVEVGKSVWKDISTILVDIGKSLGKIHGRGNGLHTVAQSMDQLAKNKTAVKAISDAIIAMAAVKGLGAVTGGISGIAKAAVTASDGIKALKAGANGIKLAENATKGQKALAALGKGFTKSKDLAKSFASASSNAFSKLKDASSNAFQALAKHARSGFDKTIQFAKNAASQIKNFAKQVPDFTKGLFGKGNGAGKLNGMLQSARSAGGFGNLSTAGKIASGAAAVGVAASSGADIYKAIKAKAGSKKQYEEIGKGAGGAIGGGIGLWLGGPAGAAIGQKIGSTMGKWAGDGAKQFQNGWNRHKPPKNFWSIENMGYSAHNMWNGFTKGVTNTINWFKKNWKEIGLYFVSPIAGGINSLYKHNPAFRKWTNGLVRGFKNAWKGMTRWCGSLGRNMANGLKSGWRGMTKWFSNVGKDIQNAWKGMSSWFGHLGNAMAKGLQAAWRGMTKFFSGIGQGIRNAWRGMTSWFTHLGSGMAKGLTNAWHGVAGFFKTIGNGITAVFRTIHSVYEATIGKVIDGINALKSGIGSVGTAIGKATHGKLQVGPLHFADGTNWKRKRPIPAILNDGHDSPETGNREGILHKNGVIELVEGTNVMRILQPDDEVINAKDMATMFGSALHLAGGTVDLSRSKIMQNLLGVMRSMVYALSSVTPKAETEAKQPTTNLTIDKVDVAPKIAKSSKQAVNDLKGNGDISKPIAKMTKKSKQSIDKFAEQYPKTISSANKKSEKSVDKFSKDFPKSLENGNKKAESSLSKFSKNYKSTWDKTWKNASKSHQDFENKEIKSSNSFHSKYQSGVRSFSNGTNKIYSHFWSEMHRTAGHGLNNVIGVLNQGISRIDSVVSQFGGNGNAVHRVGGVHYATGTGYFNGRRPITKPTFAIVNDGNDSPETDNQEAWFMPSTGALGLFRGRNLPTILPAGTEIFSASETTDLGLSDKPKHFASGTGGLHYLYELTKKFFKNTTGTLKEQFKKIGISSAGAIRKIANGAFDLSRNHAQSWWTTLWTMVNDKINDGLGPASGLLKAVEKYGEGHRYVWGAAGPTTFDCSGLVMYALKHAYGINYPHFSGSQYDMTQHISKSQARMGDLVFWGAGGSDHVGVYAGGNRYFSAQSPSQGIHMNTLSSVVGKGSPLFGRVRGVNTQGTKSTKVKAKNALQRLIRSQVGTGFWKTIQKIADKYGPKDTGIAGAPSGDHSHWMKQAGIPKYDWNMINYIVSHESGWNPNAVNPSSGTYGLGQMQSYNVHYYTAHGSKSNPIAQLMGIMDYIHDRYGSVAHAYRYWQANHNYANGGIATTPSIFGESGPEMAIPLVPTKATRAWELIGKAVAILSNNGNFNNNNQQVDKETKKFQKKFENFMDTVVQLLAGDRYVKTTIDMDGRKVAESVQKYIKQQQRKETVYQQKGFSSDPI